MERSVKRAILAYFKELGWPAWSNPRNAYTQSGLPDITFIIPKDVTYTNFAIPGFVESKDHGKKSEVSRVQAYWLKALSDAGCVSIVADSLQDVVAGVRYFGKLLGMIDLEKHRRASENARTHSPATDRDDSDLCDQL